MAARKTEDQERTEAERLEEVRDQTAAGAATKTASTPARARGDTTVPGGSYRVNGRLVNARGEPLSE